MVRSKKRRPNGAFYRVFIRFYRGRSCRAATFRRRYSIESSRAFQLAATTSPETPTVVKVSYPSVEVMSTRTPAAVALLLSSTRTL